MSARWTILLLCSVLAACGGGGNRQPPPPDADADSVADSQDCAPNDASRWQSLSFQSVDADADGRRANSSGQLCSGGSLPANYFAAAVAASDEDCNDASASVWRVLTYVARDTDADGFSAASSGSLCSGDALPTGYADALPTPLLVDCDDARATAWRFMTTYQDHDGDGVGSGSGASACIGTAAAAGFSLFGYDPLDDASNPSSSLTSNTELPAWLLTAP
jgi:hypothetical protein